MIKHRMVKIGFIAVALVAGAAMARTSTLEASGYLVSIGIEGDAHCSPGGSADCSGSAAQV